MERQELKPLLQRQLDMERSLMVSVPSIVGSQVRQNIDMEMNCQYLAAGCGGNQTVHIVPVLILEKASQECSEQNLHQK